MTPKKLFVIMLLMSSITFVDVVHSARVKIVDLRVPSGFEINYFYKNVPGARSLTLGSKGTVFVGTRQAGVVYALVDTNRDGIADKRYVIAKGLNMPNGVAFYNNDLYVAEVHRIVKYRNIESHLASPPEPEVIYSALNNKYHHGWRYISFGPDGHLYVAVGAPCNVCKPNNTAHIRRINIKTGKATIVARGVRNSVGLTWHPKTKQLWFTDNGRDLLGDDIPPDELNRLAVNGQHFGFPFCHGGITIDPVYGRAGNCTKYSKPAWKFQAHVAPLGLRFYTGSSYPKQYQNKLFVAQHGSWNRSKKVGYQITMLTLDAKGNHVLSAKTFISGWLKNERATGRPVDLLVMPDGSMLISDDKAGVIYRVKYKH